MRTRTVQILIHVFGCIAFLSLPVISSPDFGSGHLFSVPPFQRDFTFYLLLTGFFYFSYFVLIPQFYFLRRFWMFALILAACLIVVLLVPNILFPDNGIPRRMPSPRPPILMDINHRTYIFLVVGFFSMVIRISNQWRRTMQEKRNSELSYLKAQINPHFLFNTLNSIYSLAIIKSDETPKAIVKLSGMMRYVISEANTEYVPLEKEISYISDFVDLQKLRLGDTVRIDYKVTGAPGSLQIVPLLLISFVENAFKHGVNPEENSHVQITIDIGSLEVNMVVMNNKVTERIHNKTGIGVESTKNRLNLSYPSRHSLEIEDNSQFYKVSLAIRLR